jgi:hypothetical protein
MVVHMGGLGRRIMNLRPALWYTVSSMGWYSGVAQIIECLPSKSEVSTSNSCTAKTTQKNKNTRVSFRSIT